MCDSGAGVRRAAAAGSVLLLSLLAAGCAQETIAHQQEEREANRILVLLRQGGMEPAKLKDEESRELRFNIMVPQDQAATALALLEAHDLPKTPRPDTAAMFQEGG